MTRRLRELVASGLVALAVIIVLWWLLRRVIGLVVWLANLTVLVVVVVLLLGAVALELTWPVREGRRLELIDVRW